MPIATIHGVGGHEIPVEDPGRRHRARREDEEERRPAPRVTVPTSVTSEKTPKSCALSIARDVVALQASETSSYAFHHAKEVRPDGDRGVGEDRPEHEPQRHHRRHRHAGDRRPRPAGAGDQDADACRQATRRRRHSGTGVAVAAEAAGAAAGAKAGAGTRTSAMTRSAKSSGGRKRSRPSRWPSTVRQPAARDAHEAQPSRCVAQPGGLTRGERAGHQVLQPLVGRVAALGGDAETGADAARARAAQGSASGDVDARHDAVREALAGASTGRSCSPSKSVRHPSSLRSTTGAGGQVLLGTGALRGGELTVEERLDLLGAQMLGEGSVVHARTPDESFRLALRLRAGEGFTKTPSRDRGAVRPRSCPHRNDVRPLGSRRHATSASIFFSSFRARCRYVFTVPSGRSMISAISS